MRLGWNRWGKSAVRVSKIHRSDGGFSDVTVQVLLQGDVDAAHTVGDNRGVIPTDTMRNTVYCLAQDHLGADLEAFVATLAAHFTERESCDVATVRAAARRWDEVESGRLIGGTSEVRTASHSTGDQGRTSGLDGLVVLKTGDSAFVGFPRDEFTTLPEAEDRLLSTTVGAEWRYTDLPDDTTAAWTAARAALLDGFFDRWSASVQHQGWLMAGAVFDAVPEIDQITLNLPNQHHLAFDLTRFGVEDRGVVFHPVSEPYGDIALTVHRT